MYVKSDRAHENASVVLNKHTLIIHHKLIQKKLNEIRNVCAINRPMILNYDTVG